MKLRGYSYAQVQARFQLAGLPSSRSTVTRILRAAGIVANRITYKTRRFDQRRVDSAIANLIRTGPAAGPVRHSRR